MAQQGAGPGNAGMRASDADRERLVEQLKEHHAAGRLSLDEFEERMRQAYDAKTFGELAVLTHDLPIDLATLHPKSDAASRYGVRSPADEVKFAVAGAMTEVQAALSGNRHEMHHQNRRQRDVMRAQRHGGLSRRRGGISWASMSVFLLGIWLITAVTGGGEAGFWPVWPIGVTGLLLLARQMNGRGRR